MNRVNVRQITGWDVVAIDKPPLRAHVLAEHLRRCGIADNLVLSWKWVSPGRLLRKGGLL